jgi:PAS domain S-box-containing protein
MLNGQTVSTAVGVHNPWMTVEEAGALLLLAFLADALFAAWRHGDLQDRRRAAIVGGSFLLLIFMASAQSLLVHRGIIPAIPMNGIGFAVVMMALALEVSADLVHTLEYAARLQTAERSLQQSEERLKEAAEAAKLVVWQWDVKGDEFLIGESGRAHLGFARAERINLRRFLSVVHPEDQEAVRIAAIRTSKIGRPFEPEFRLVSRDGSVRWISTHSGVDLDAGGGTAFVHGVLVDVTAHKRDDDALRHERAFLRQVIDINPNLVFAKDRQGRFTLANNAVAELYGTTADELIGKTDADFNGNAEQVAHFRRIDLEVMDSLQEQVVFEEQITDAAGEVRFLQTVKRPLVEPDGTASQVLGTATDITARRKVELELAAQRNELAHFARVTMLSELSGSIAHELNQPLAAILSNAQAALRFLDSGTPDLDEIRDILRDIVGDNKRASEVMLGLRALLKKGTTRNETLHASEIIKDTYRLVRSDLLNADVSMSFDITPALPEMKGDRAQLQQVLINLIINGSDAMIDTRPSERVMTVSAGLAEGGLVLISVDDQGTGMAPENFKRVFEPFFTTKPQGLGLGLSVCRQIITAHGGRLWGENRTGGGAKFSFTIPANPTDKA